MQALLFSVYIEKTGDHLLLPEARRSGADDPGVARYMNRIDMGIYLCILELCLKYGGSDIL